MPCAVIEQMESGVILNLVWFNRPRPKAHHEAPRDTRIDDQAEVASKRCRIEVKPLRNRCDMIMKRLMNNKRTKARCIKRSMRQKRGPKSLPDGARLKQNRREMGEV